MADELLTAEHFQPHTGKIVRLDGTGKELRIGRIEKHAQSPGIAREPFTVIFSGPRGQTHLVPEGTYECRVEDGPSWVLYLMPIHTVGSDRQDYQAAFN